MGIRVSCLKLAEVVKHLEELLMSDADATIMVEQRFDPRRPDELGPMILRLG